MGDFPFFVEKTENLPYTSDMGWADNYIRKLESEKEISFRPRGDSMSPRINSGDLVTVTSDVKTIERDDIVLCKVGGKQYLHLVKAVDGDCYQIGNNKGRINGWTKQIYGKVINVVR